MIGEQTTESLLQLGFEGLFYLITLIFVIFSASVAYHWFSYGTRKTTALTALIIYLSVGTVLLLTAGAILLTM